MIQNIIKDLRMIYPKQLIRFKPGVMFTVNNHLYLCATYPYKVKSPIKLGLGDDYHWFITDKKGERVCIYDPASPWFYKKIK